MKLVETCYCDHGAYRMEADALRGWIVSTSETVESLTAGTESLSKEQLELVLIKLNVRIVFIKLA